MMQIALHSFPICLVVSLTMVALEEDELKPYIKRFFHHFGSLYGGIIAFSLACVAIEYLFVG